MQAGVDPITLRGKLRSLLAVLLLHANHVVSVEKLAEALWGLPLPAGAAGRVRTLVSELRRACADSLIVTAPPGYLLPLADGQLDLDQFNRGVDLARQEAADGRPDEAVARFDEALALWRGVPLGGASGPFVEAHTGRLEELRLRAVEGRAEAMLASARHNELVAELGQLVVEHPLRERPHALLMTALYRDGRRGEALELYRELRARLVSELGLEPTEQMQQLHRQLLSSHSTLGSSWTAQASPAPARTPIRQLPADQGTFVGRRAELDRLDTYGSGPGRLVLVTGPAGVGKTSLVVHWAHQLSHRFPDGQLFLDLRGFHAEPQVSAAQAVPLLLVALGVAADGIPADLDAQVALYRSMLAGRRLLVVLDNVADAHQVRPLIPGDAGCLVLAISRDRLSGLVAVDSARRITLDVLPATEAVEVLAHAAGRERIHAAPDAAAELARLCGRLPLALRIAGARLADRPDLDLRDYVVELATRGWMTRLRVDGDESATLRAAFDLSYRALTPEARRLFRLLGLAPARAELAIPAAAALTGLPADEVEPLIDALARLHLVKVTTDGRVLSHDLLLDYAATLAGEHDQPAERDAAMDRLLHYYLNRANPVSIGAWPEGHASPRLLTTPARRGQTAGPRECHRRSPANRSKPGTGWPSGPA